MNPLTNMKNVIKLSERELQNTSKSSWHDQYRDSAWIFIGGLPYDLTEGDIICVFSQYGEVVNINLIRDKDTGKSKGFCFLCYEDQRSTVLAVDNFNGIKVLNRILRVDHVSEYKIPKQGKKTDEETKMLYNEGCAPKPIVPNIKNPLIDDLEYRRETLADQIQADIKLPARLPIYNVKKETHVEEELIDVKTEKTDMKKKKKKSQDDSDSEDDIESKSRRKEKLSKKNYLSSETSSEREKKTYKRRRSRSRSFDPSSDKRQRSRSQSFEKNKKHRSRSRSPERKSRKSQFREHKDNRSNRRRSRSKDCNESRKRFDAKSYDKHRR